jgi:hypothetical protein
MQTVKNKIGIGLITCDREDFYEKSIESLKKACENNKNSIFVVVDDGEAEIKNKPQNYIKTKGREGVAKAKNKAIEFLKQECEHIFLMEDDIEIINDNVFNFYINASKKSGIKHFNYALHGNHNLDFLNRPQVRKTVKYPNCDVSIDLYGNVLGAFSYYHIDTIKDVGLMDEKFWNALEHVDHTYQIIQKKYHPSFRWFADVTGSCEYLKDIVPNHQQSKIRSEENFQQTFKKALDYFIDKNKFSVVSGYGPKEKIVTEKEIILELRYIWENHRDKNE